jgi:diguanylate cyclase (GGDEF)-like protein
VQAHALATHLNLGLVFVSIATAILASYVALDLAQRSADSQTWVKRLWTGGAGITMGLGIWSMHFVGMLALEMGMPVSYNGVLVVLSLLAAVIGASVSFAVVARPHVSRRALVSAGAFMGFAIAAMHYLGMASMQMDAVIHWNIGLFVLSLAIGFGASLFGLWLVVRVRVSSTDFGFARRLLASVLLGLGVAGLHYTAMASSSFLPANRGMVAHPGFRTNSIVLMLAIGAAVMLAVLIGGAGIDQRRAALAKDLSLVANLARQLARLGNARDRVCNAIGELAGADYVLLIEPLAGGGQSVTASAGACSITDYPLLPDDPRVRSAMSSGRHLFISDLAADDAAGTRLTELTNAASVLLEPLSLDSRPVGVLVVVWSQRLATLPARMRTFLEMLAAESAVAIDRETLLSQLEYLSRRDELTGLLNRRVLGEELERQLAANRRQGSPLSVVMLDLDHFKRYNDEQGHQAGDRLLRSAAAAWTAVLRETDTIARYGGEEFIAILPDCTTDAAIKLAEKLREALPAGVTCSAGVATAHGTISTSDLIGAADRALYRAKRAGRDTTRVDRRGRDHLSAIDRRAAGRATA